MSVALAGELAAPPCEAPEAMVAYIAAERRQADEPREPLDEPTAARPMHPRALTSLTLPHGRHLLWERLAVCEGIARRNPQDINAYITERAITACHEVLMPFVGDAIENGCKDRKEPGPHPAGGMHLKGPPKESSEHGVFAYMRQLSEQEIIGVGEGQL
jgi:hypothetical protein